MSYRTYINGHAWLGNNECPEVILKELERQGCQFNDDWCGPFDDDNHIVPFEIKDLNGLVKATERAILEMVEENPEVADFNKSVDFWKNNLTYGMSQLATNAYIFWSSKLLDLVGKDNYTESMEMSDDDFKVTTVYKLKPGVKCLFNAY